MSGLVYYIACTETQRLKIGYTIGRVKNRLKALQTGAPSKLVIIAFHPGTQEDERALHERFAAERLRGEWFEMSEDLFAHISFVTWVAAKGAIYDGAPIEDWVRVGLENMQQYCGPLPKDLAALICH